MTRPPVALAIAGSDPSGGAGIQADLKTFSALGVYGTTVLTALTAQSTQGVTGVHPVPPDFVAQQLQTLVDDVQIDAVKIGMLGPSPLVEVVAAFLRERGETDPYAVVLDPVMVATSGDRLVDEQAVGALRDLVPLASVITPNIAEAAVLLEEAEAGDVETMAEQARRLRVEVGAPRVLLKGGHLSGAVATDVWADEDGIEVLEGPRVSTRHTHGTGCSLSSAMAALAARGGLWRELTREAKSWLSGAIEAGSTWEIGHGSGPVHHFHQTWRNVPALPTTQHRAGQHSRRTDGRASR